MPDSKDENSSLREPREIAIDDPSPEGGESVTGDDFIEENTQPQEGLDPLEALQADVARWRDLALRSQADLDNYRKRMAREKADALKFANAGLLDSILPIIDNFRLGLEAARGEEGSTIYQGMSMVLKQIEDFLKEQDVEEIATENAAFDPNLHEAVLQEHHDKVPEGNVIRELRKGYKLKDRLLRASNIVVSKGPE